MAGSSGHVMKRGSERLADVEWLRSCKVFKKDSAART